MSLLSAYSLLVTRYSLPNNERGDIAVYLSLVMVSVMLASAVLFSLILARQIRSTEDAVASERAFYAASTGLEQGLYQMSKQLQVPGDIVELRGDVAYGSGEVATYEGKTQLVDGVPCVVMTGRYRSSQRRLRLGVPDCLPE